MMGRTTIRKVVSWFAALGIALASRAALAGDESRLGVRFQQIVSGDDHPSILLEPREGVVSLKIRLERTEAASQGSAAGGGSQSAPALSSGALAAGTHKALTVTQPFGTFDYTAHFETKFANGDNSAFDMKFSLTRVDKLKLELAAEDVNLEKRTLSFRINNPAKSATLEVYGKSGAKLAAVAKNLAGTPGGTAIAMSWTDPGEEVLYIELKVTDVAGFWKGMRLSPFTVNIPHEELEFESGKSDIRPTEEPKLQKTLGLIKDALEKYGKLIDMRLYVAGYTDTVGSKESNRVLSANRARAIAGWYAKNGLRIPIFFQGFGEDALAKPTPDETAEQANRRALYILAGQTPSTTTNLPKANWARH